MKSAISKQGRLTNNVAVGNTPQVTDTALAKTRTRKASKITITRMNDGPRPMCIPKVHISPVQRRIVNKEKSCKYNVSH